MSQNLNSAVAVIGIDIGKNHSMRSALTIAAPVLRQKWSRGQIDDIVIPRRVGYQPRLTRALVLVRMPEAVVGHGARGVRRKLRFDPVKKIHWNRTFALHLDAAAWCALEARFD
jgi:hypothetical protein